MRPVHFTIQEEKCQEVFGQFPCVFPTILLYYPGNPTVYSAGKWGVRSVKTKTWILLLGAVFLLSLMGSFFVLRKQPDTALAEVSSSGTVVKTVNLHENQQFTVTAENGGVNTITVQDGKIAVTEATCPDHYCMKRGFCASGTDIVCLPNKLVIHFIGAQTVDAAVG